MRKLVALAVLVFAVTILASCSKIATVEYSVPLYEVTDGVAEIKTWENVATSSFTVLTSKMTTLTDGVYAVTQTVTLDSLEINGDVIIVMGDYSLNVIDTVKVNGHLTVCGKVDTSAKLIVLSEGYGFSGDGKLSLYGGRINVTSKYEAIATEKADIIYADTILASTDRNVMAEWCDVVMSWSEFGFYGDDKYDMMWLYANDSSVLAENRYAEIAHEDEKIYYVDEDGEVLGRRQYRIVRDETDLTEGTWLLTGSTKPLTAYGNVKIILAAGADINIDGGSLPALTVSDGSLSIYGENSTASQLNLSSSGTAVRIASNADVTFVSGIVNIEGKETGIEGNISLEGAHVKVSGEIAVDGDVIADLGKLTANGIESSITGSCVLGELMTAKSGNTAKTAESCGLPLEAIDVSASRYAELSVPVSSTRSYSFSAKSMGISGEMTMTYDFTSLTDADYTKFSADTAKMSFLVCINAHGIAKFSSGGSDDYSFTEMLGFSETKEYQVKGDGIDEDDTTTMVVSLMILDDTTRFVSVSFLGTGSSSEWASNFDIGETSGLYESITGKHPDWVTKDNHKGFDVAATRAIKLLKSYVKAHGLEIDGITTIYGFTGYSRGAAIANIVASKFGTADFSLGGNAKSFAYTFATPNTTVSADAKDARYNCIFSFVNADDIVPTLPPEAIGFVRYGHDVKFDITETAGLTDMYRQMSGSKYNREGIADVVSVMNAICTSRTEYYTIDTSTSAQVKTVKTTEADAIDARDTLIKRLTEICGDEYVNYVTVGDVTHNETDGTYVFTFGYSIAFIGKMLPDMLKYANFGNTVALLSYYSYLGCEKMSGFKSAVVKLIAMNPSGLLSMHLPVPYCVYIDSLK